MTDPQPPGLQAERTMLAWERTAVGLLATAALLALRATRLPDLAPGAVALLLALAVALIGRHRARRIMSAPDGVRAPAAAVLLTGGGVVALGLLTLAVVLAPS